jgi:hypothetical protein
MSEALDSMSISTMTADDVRLAVEWAAREGWNPGATDAACFHAADPRGFLIGRIGDEPVAVISAVRYPDRFAFIGLYIVEPRWRGRGLGWAVWSAAMDRVADDVVGLDGVVEQQANYATSGFVLAHRNIRFGGVPLGAAHDGVDVLARADLLAVAAYDEPCFGSSRRAFLQGWLDMPGALAAGIRSEKGLLGYGVIRPAAQGFKVGPLFADDAVAAEAILGRLVEHAGPGAPVFLDVPEPNGEAVRLAREQGLAPVFETARMYRGGSLDLPLTRTFGITTFELG